MVLAVAAAEIRATLAQASAQAVLPAAVFRATPAVTPAIAVEKTVAMNVSGASLSAVAAIIAAVAIVVAAIVGSRAAVVGSAVVGLTVVGLAVVITFSTVAAVVTAVAIPTQPPPLPCLHTLDVANAIRPQQLQTTQHTNTSASQTLTRTGSIQLFSVCTDIAPIKVQCVQVESLLLLPSREQEQELFSPMVKEREGSW